MKLRNKKTGEIVDAFSLGAEKSVWEKQGKHFKLSTDDWCKNYNSLAELNEEWEDYEEDELLYVVSAEHKSGYQCVLKEDYPEICKVAKELGIGFETEKECQKAVEKLKAWKRLKDGGFYFTIDAIEDGEYKHNLILRLKCNEEAKYKPIKECKKYRRDIHLIFGGKR